MEIEPELKPLYANLKRIRIGEYLYTKDFELFVLENNLDVLWKSCIREVNRKRRVVMLGYHSTEDEEEAFIYLLTAWCQQHKATLHQIILTVLLNFARWHKSKLDYSSIMINLKQITPKEKFLNFTKDFQKIQESKSAVVEEAKLEHDNPLKVTVILNKSKVFIVHGHDETAKTKAARFVEKLGFEAIILHEQASSSLTIIV